MHIAIIMDGNGRWAAAKGKSRSHGHKHGAESARRIVLAAQDRGIEHLTLYAFSSENWQRPKDEIKQLMDLLRHYLGKEISELHKHNVRVDVIGDKENLPEDIQKKIIDSEKKTANNTGIFVHIALSYGSRQELEKAAKNGDISQNLYTKHIPDPDLLIRTGGEQRLSNFLLWQMAYTELYFTPILWPDFSESDLDDSLEEFHKRERRFGNA